MNNILFLVHTEFHIYMISGVIQRYFDDLAQYKVSVILPYSEKSRRFKLEFNWDELPMKFYRLPIKEDNLVYSKEAHELVEQVKSIDYSHYFCFHEHSPLNYHFSSYFSRRETKVCLLQEGTFPYITFSKSALPSRVKSTLMNYRFLHAQKLSWRGLQMVSNSHGFLKETEEVWLQDKEKYPNRNRKKVFETDLYPVQEHIEKTIRFFNFQIQTEVSQTSGIILYLNHWFVVKEIYDYEIKVLQSIRSRYTDRPLVIKLHPNTPDHQIERFKALDDVTINRSTVPAELFIASIEKSLVISFWSASLLRKNPSCHFYWMYQMLLKDNQSMKWWSITNPSDHIKSITSLDEMHAI